MLYVKELKHMAGAQKTLVIIVLTAFRITHCHSKLNYSPYRKLYRVGVVYSI